MENKNKLNKGSITIETLVFLPTLIILLMLMGGILKFDTDLALIDSHIIGSLRDISDIDTRIQLVGVDDIYENIIEREDIKKIIKDIEIYNTFSESKIFSIILEKFESMEKSIGNNVLYEKILQGFYEEDIKARFDGDIKLYNIPDFDSIKTDIDLQDDSILVKFKYDYSVLGQLADFKIPISVDKRIGRYDISGMDIVGLLSKLGSETVYITKTGKKYHLEDCDYLKKSKKAVKLKDLDKDVYKPCKLCIEKKVYGGLKYHGKH